MGNYRFKLSEMMPNSWFYKLKDMGSRRSRGNRGSRAQAVQNSLNKNPPPSPPSKPLYLTNRPSNYITSKDRLQEKHHHSTSNHKASDTQFPSDTPRQSKKKPWKKPLNSSTQFTQSPVSSVYSCPKQSSSIQNSEFDASESLFILEHKLQPIQTKPNKREANKAELADRNPSTKQGRSPRMKIRMHSPRLAKRRLQALRNERAAAAAEARRREGMERSFVVVKSSSDPQKDFRESMVEMIVENNLIASKDLEELLACYLSLNSHEYHDMIVEVFEQIWVALAEIIF